MEGYEHRIRIPLVSEEDLTESRSELSESEIALIGLALFNMTSDQSALHNSSSKRIGWSSRGIADQLNVRPAKF